MNIVLYLMNEKGLSVLNKLCESFGTNIISEVVGSRDPNVHNDYYEEIRFACKQRNIPFINREKKKNCLYDTFHLAVGWRWVIPSAKKLIVFHDSLLPKYRGFSPLVNSLINGEREIGVTALFASDRYDCGDIIDQKSVQIEYPITIAQAIAAVAPLYQDLAEAVVESIQTNSLHGFPQDELNATYSIWRDEEDYHVDWSHSAEEIVRFIDAVGYPYFGATSWLGSNQVRIIKALSVGDVKLEQRHVGKVIFVEDGLPVIIAGKGLVKIVELKGVDDCNMLPLNKFRTRFR